MHTFDALGRATNAFRNVQPLSMVSTNVYAYNARYEVIGADIETNNYVYVYDGIGNNIYTSLNAITNAYTVNNLNQYKAVTNLMDFTGFRLGHDADGNTSFIDGNSLLYDSENRLFAYIFGLNNSTTGTLRSAYVYDYLGRRVKKMEQECKEKDSGGIGYFTYWQTNAVTTYVYDGWNLVHERLALTNGTTQEVSYFWGKDLSGSLQGAGGVGGLLAASIDGDFFFPCYDNNGNITAYIDEGGSVIAYRQYDAFGNTTSKGGDMVDVFHFWYSTKYLDHDTGLYYYGYRYYSPMLHRWINRDPIEEEGGLNLYGFCENNSISAVDCFGKFSIYVETLGSGHVGIMDENGTGYDYGRYFASYLGLPGPFSGPNILRKINGWSSDDKIVLHSVFTFNVCPRLDKLVTEALELKFSQGQKTLPSSVLKKYLKPPSRKLTENERYMGSDWTPNNNCITFTFGTITTALSPIVRNPKNFTQKERKQAMAILVFSYAAAWQVAPLQIKWMLEQASLSDWIKSSKTGGKNDKKNDAKSCCGSST